MGGISDRLSPTAAIFGAATLSIPLAVAVLRLGGDHVAPAGLGDLDG
jgi:hypothetical protein